MSEEEREKEIRKIILESFVCYIKQGFEYDENITILYLLISERIINET